MANSYANEYLDKREIDINIEGYNVNGICVGCLNYNRKMFYHSAVAECFNLIGNIDVPDGLTIQVCWECLATIKSIMRFRLQILYSYDVLSNYSKEHTFLDSPMDLADKATSRFSSILIPIEPFGDFDGSETIIKADLDLDAVKEEFNIEYSDGLAVKSESDYNDILSDFAQEDRISSEDDIKLSKLKKKKHKKGKKRHREQKESQEQDTTLSISKRRIAAKLKNLPPDLVELFTMSEKEMWETRSLDVADESFASRKYKCDLCVITFNTERLMTDHFNGKHKSKGDNSCQCDVCQAYFLTKDTLSSHRNLHLVAFKCRQCGFSTTLKGVMEKHVATHARSLPTYICPTCGASFGTKSRLVYHRGVCHRERPQCDCCGKVFANKVTLRHHLRAYPPNYKEKPKEKLYIPCKGCGKVFHSQKSYRSHVVIHNGVTYPCPICGKQFQWKRNLSRHTRNHREKDQGALHECRECGKSFSSRDCYNNHMKLSKKHVAEENYAHECNYCGKKFSTKWCLVDHIDWEHLKRIKYQCNVCFKAFKTSKIMVAHVNNIHGGKKNKEVDGEHLCDICGKSYKTVKRLKGHVWAMHTTRSTSKSFKCKLCPATFTWQTSIYKHMKIMHDNNKKSKSRALPSVKKQEPSYSEIELANRMQYYQDNLASNIVQNIVPSIGLVQNII